MAWAMCPSAVHADAKNMTEADLDKPLPFLDKHVSESAKDEYGRVK
jgi:hypothetical protein